jgi:glutathione synthase
VPEAEQRTSVGQILDSTAVYEGLLFVGIDGNLTEINVTSPTGIRAIARLGGPDVAAMIWDTIEAKRGGK